MSEAINLDDFRAQVHDWVTKNLPPALKGKNFGIEMDHDISRGGS